MAVLINVVVSRSFIELLALKALGYFFGGGGECCWDAKNHELDFLLWDFI